MTHRAQNFGYKLCKNLINFKHNELKKKQMLKMFVRCSAPWCARGF